jgi:DNA-binding transcriptional MerR regulator
MAGVSSDTLRHYERVGVLPRPPRGENGYRLYPAEALERLRLVRRAMGIGFTLEELARLLRARANGAPPCREARLLAARKLEEVEQRLRELEALREELVRTISDWDARLEGASSGEPARLLESLSKREQPPAGARRRRQRIERRSRRKEEKR